MEFYRLPDASVDGLKVLVNLSEADIFKLKKAFDNAQIGDGIKELTEKNLSDFDLSDFDLFNLIRSLFYFVGTYVASKKTYDTFLPDFINSYSYKTREDKNEVLEKLKNYLNILSSSFTSVIKTQKTKDLLTENHNNFLNSRIISDVRIVYDDEKDLSEKEQCALVVHNLKIGFFSKANKQDEIFISLNLSDLENLRKTIERAIEKDKLIREKNHELTFVNIE